MKKQIPITELEPGEMATVEIGGVEHRIERSRDFKGLIGFVDMDCPKSAMSRKALYPNTMVTVDRSPDLSLGDWYVVEGEDKVHLYDEDTDLGEDKVTRVRPTGFRVVEYEMKPLREFDVGDEAAITIGGRDVTVRVKGHKIDDMTSVECNGWNTVLPSDALARRKPRTWTNPYDIPVGVAVRHIGGYYDCKTRLRIMGGGPYHKNAIGPDGEMIGPDNTDAYEEVQYEITDYEVLS